MSRHIRQAAGLTRAAGGLGLSDVAAYDLTERTTTATASTDLVTLTPSVPVGNRTAFSIQGRIRKSAGAAAGVLIGFKIGSTQIISNYLVTSASNRAESGMLSLGLLYSGETSYSFGFSSTVIVAAASGVVAAFQPSGFAAAIPAAPLTSFVITGRTNSPLITLAVRDVYLSVIALP